MKGPPRIETVDDIDYRLEPQTWRFSIDEADAIDRHWDKLSAANPHLFNGRVLLMRRGQVEARGDRRILCGGGFAADYKAFLSWRDFGCPGEDAANCFSMAALVSADGAFMLGQMGPHTANAGTIYFPSGTPDPADLKGDMIDLEGSVLRELHEETGIKAEEVTVARGWTIVFDGARVACMKIVRSALAAAELEARFGAFIASQSMPELVALHPVFTIGDVDEERMPAFMSRFLRQALGGSQLR